MDGKKPVTIFISYRWDYSYEVAKILQRAIEARFDGVFVFRDEERAEPGKSLTETILGKLAEASILLALFHKNWQKEPVINERSYANKLFSKDDWVRMELDHAKNNLGLTVIPVLCNGATLPPRNEPVEIEHALPKCLHYLTDDTLAKKLDKSNDSEEGILQFLETALQLTRKAQPAAVASLRDRLKDEGLDLPEDDLPNRKEVPAPYLGIQHFEEKHTRLFFGRSDDICNLWDLMDRKPQRLILLYGYSGVGKSSLLHAGLFPRMKQKGWRVEAERRNKRNLADLLAEMLASIQETGKTLISLDQVEEALIEPTGPEPELPPLFDALEKALEKHPKIKVVLGFRKEFLPEVQAQIVRTGLKDKTADFFLKPLEDAGLMEAIRLDKKLKDHYGFEFEPGLEEKIAGSIVEQDSQVHGGETSSRAPWLQILLCNLWDTAEKRHSNTVNPLVLLEKDLDEARAESFDALVKNQLLKLETAPEPHNTFARMGLTLDLLHFLTASSRRTTAAIRADQELSKRYNLTENVLTDHLRLLENYQLVIRVTGRQDQPLTRLAHDALAPVIRQEFERSDKPAQRAHRIFESKKTTLTNGQVEFISIQDEEDIRILNEAEPYMYRWSAGARDAYERGRKTIKAAKVEREKNMAFIFDSFAEVGKDLIKTVDAEAALEKMKVAVEVDFDFNEKRQKLLEPLEELVYFFAEGGKRPDLAGSAAELLLKLTPYEQLQAAIQKCRNESWNKHSDFLPIIGNLSGLSVFKTRYYPEMVDIQGGSFTMGSPESDPFHQSDEQAHEVKLSSFRIASTPVTFYQFALFCEATGKSIASMTPSWGRFGDHPLVNISWYNAIEFCNWLSEQTPGLEPCYRIIEETNSDPDNRVSQHYLKWRVEWDKSANGFRLPTNAEWEFAARGGLRKQKFAYAGSDVLHEVGWFWENSCDQPLSGNWDQNTILNNNCRTHPVGQKQDNGIGLYDLSGNVWEWCWDWYDGNYYADFKKSETTEDPTGPESSNSGRVLRGGSWNSLDYNCRVAFRSWYDPDLRLNVIGFRPAQDLY